VTFQKCEVVKLTRKFAMQTRVKGRSICNALKAHTCANTLRRIGDLHDESAVQIMRGPLVHKYLSVSAPFVENSLV
jgi:Ser/Thr protein kinase RdoA (MazF antagonist)